MSIQYFLPTSAPARVTNYDLHLDSGKTGPLIGLLANGFPDGEIYLRRQAEAISALIPNARFRLETKGTTDQLSACVAEPLLSDMAAECDAVIIAWGHCGSCTSGVTRDAIAFAERGIPSVMLICDIFWDYAEWLGPALGMAGLPRVQIPYPMAGTGEANQRALAEKIAPQLLASLTRH